MIFKKQIILLLTLGFGLYSMLAVMLMNPFIVVDSNYTILDLVIIFSCSSIIIYILFLLFRKDGIINTTIFLSSAAISSIFTGTLIWFKMNSSEPNFLLFISSFIIAAIPPTIIALLYMLLNKLKNPYQIDEQELPKELDINYYELKNTKGKTTFKVNSSDILYFESNDNYVLTFYKNNEGDIKKSMDRISLKKVEDLLGIKNIKFERVHKSFLINPKYVKEIAGRSQAYKIIMNDTDFEIPVSRKFDVSIFDPSN